MGRSESLTQTFSALCFMAAGLMFIGRVYSTVNPSRLPAAAPEPAASLSPVEPAPLVTETVAETAIEPAEEPAAPEATDLLLGEDAQGAPQGSVALPRLSSALLPVAQQTLGALSPSAAPPDAAMADAAVVDLSDRRVYLYQGEQVMADYAVGIGRQHWETPTGDFQVIDKQENPVWRHPFTRQIVPPGPENPLGSRWIGFWTNGTHEIGFHGTNNNDAIGQAVSHGCIRMRNADVEALYKLIPMGASITVRP